MQQLQEVGQRMAVVKRQLVNPSPIFGPQQIAELVAELRYLMRITLETPATLARLIGRTQSIAANATMRPSATSRPPTCGSWSRSPSGIAIAA